MAINTKSLIKRSCRQVDKEKATVIGKIQRVKLVDADSGKILKNVEYCLFDEEGDFEITGKSDDQGYISYIPKGKYKIIFEPVF